VKNTLFYGDNLDVMRRYIADETVDLVYLDPPFNSNADYNVLFSEHSGDRAAAQIKAFEDTWTWDVDSARAYQEVVESGGALSETMQAFRQMLGGSDMLAYLAMMAPRLVDLHRVLKPAGSIYLHCDPTASHYLKLLMDAVFGIRQFENEIVWKRTSAHSSSKRYGPVHDVILFYSKSDGFTWNQQYVAYDEVYLASHYRAEDSAGRRFTLSDLTAAGVRHGSSGQVWRGFDPTGKGNHWKFTIENLERLDVNGRLYWPRNGGWPRYIRYLDELKGVPMQDVWVDLDAINAKAQERLGYPTQKPEALLHRIISASSNPGDTVLDPFCGCGTTISVAEQLGRPWLGIDVTHLAIGLIKHRLQEQFGPAIVNSYNVVGEPVSLPDAARLAADDAFQFQAWALGLVGARKEGSSKKGADRGIDGTLYFHDDPKGKAKRIILSVKAGANVSVSMVRDLVGTVTREKADLGVLISFTKPTKPMETEAADAGFYVSPMGGRHPKIQILTIEELLAGKGIDYPTRSQRADLTFRKARRIVSEVPALPLSAFIAPGANLDPEDDDQDAE